MIEAVILALVVIGVNAWALNRRELTPSERRQRALAQINKHGRRRRRGR